MLLCVRFATAKPAIYLSFCLSFYLHCINAHLARKLNKAPNASNNNVNTHHKYLLYIIALAQLFFALKLISNRFLGLAMVEMEGKLINTHTHKTQTHPNVAFRWQNE